MATSLVTSTPISVLEQVVAFTEARHDVLAGNIANLDTPGYRVRDLSVDQFQETLKDVIEASSGGEISDADAALLEASDSMKHILFHDGSDVGMEQQVTEITKNQFMHNLAISILSSQYRMLESAITEQP